MAVDTWSDKVQNNYYNIKSWKKSHACFTPELCSFKKTWEQHYEFQMPVLWYIQRQGQALVLYGSRRSLEQQEKPVEEQGAYWSVLKKIWYLVEIVYKAGGWIRIFPLAWTSIAGDFNRAQLPLKVNWRLVSNALRPHWKQFLPMNNIHEGSVSVMSGHGGGGGAW